MWELSDRGRIFEKKDIACRTHILSLYLSDEVSLELASLEKPNIPRSILRDPRA